MPLWDKTGWIPAPQRVAAVLWITFLMAGVATGAFFSAIDPQELKYCVSFPEVSRLGAYTVGFLHWLGSRWKGWPSNWPSESLSTSSKKPKAWAAASGSKQMPSERFRSSRCRWQAFRT